MHLNRLIKKYDLDMIFLAGPGHGAPGVLGPVYLEGTYSEIYPDKSEDEEGLREFFKQFSFPGGIGSHCTPETPGSIHEGGELGYVLSHACGAAFDNPDLIVAAVVGDGESETGAAGDFLAHQQVPESRFATARCCPSCTSTATRSTTRRCWRASATRSWRACCAATAGRPTSWKAPTPTACTRPWPPRVEHCVDEIRRIQQRGPRDRRAPRARAGR